MAPPHPISSGAGECSSCLPKKNPAHRCGVVHGSKRQLFRSLSILKFYDMTHALDRFVQSHLIGIDDQIVAVGI